MSEELSLGLFRRRRRVRFIHESDTAESGLACLLMIANYYELNDELGALRQRLRLSIRGTVPKSLLDMSDELGFAGRLVEHSVGEIRHLHLPAILMWTTHHYVVLEEVRGGRALIHDPETKSRWMTLDEMSNRFTGIALELRPTDTFKPADQIPRLRLADLWSRITGLKRALVQTIVLSLVMQAFVLASPYYMQVVLDSAVPALDLNLLTVLAVGFGLFTLFNVLAGLLRGFVLLSAGNSIGYGIAINVARRLFRLPIGWFDKRHIGDVLSRFQSIQPIRQFLTESAVATVLDGSLALFTLAIMFFYSPALTLIALISFGLYALARAVSFAAQRKAQGAAIVMSSREQSAMIESIRGVVTLRLFNRETARHALWQTRLADSMNANVSLARIGIWLNSANSLIFGLEGIITVWLAARLLISGGFSTGMVFAYFAYKSQFTQKAATLIDQAVAYQMLGLHLERLSDIALAEQDPSFDRPVGRTTQLRGKLELRDVSFRYSSADPLLFDKINLVIEQGEHLIITGPSGGGKSTLMKIILGLIEPSEGTVLIDDLPLSQFGYKQFHTQLGAVLQDDHLFAGSLSDNIALFDEMADMRRILESAKLAALHDEIDLMPLGYETLVGDMGSALSGGQRQRLLLARAFYRAPRLLVLDEATSNLDREREEAVLAAIADMRITRIVITHRVATIDTAARIVELRNGAMVDISEEVRSEPLDEDGQGKESLTSTSHRRPDSR